MLVFKPSHIVPQVHPFLPSPSHLLRALTHDDAAALVILQGPVGMAHHLQHIIDGVVHVPKADRQGGMNSRWLKCQGPLQDTCLTCNNPLGYSRVDLAIVVLCVHDDHQVGSNIHAPAEAPGGHHHLHCTWE